jgi:dual 3',5'-cyclic-AMP and -GMP phosphodiesterase 11
LYESLDLKTTCKKIFNTVSLLLDADRCSLFLVVDDDKAESKKCLISVVFDAQSVSKLLQSSNNDLLDASTDQSYEQIKIQFGQGIAGHVALTGRSLNIPDAYLDSRFNSNIDKITGYKTKSIFCLPILNIFTTSLMQSTHFSRFQSFSSLSFFKLFLSISQFIR